MSERIIALCVALSAERALTSSDIQKIKRVSAMIRRVDAALRAA